MGRNKALLPFGANLLWERQYHLLTQAGVTERWISVRSDDDWAPSHLPRVYDDGAAGPLGGLLAALEVCSGTHLVVVATDIPQLPVSWFQTLRRNCSAGRGSVGWRNDIEAYEPLAAIYPRELVAGVRNAITAKEFSFQTLLSAAVAGGFFDVQTISPEQLRWFQNWNKPEDVVE